MNIWTNWGPANFKKVDFVWAAQARANNVLPMQQCKIKLKVKES
jgi:hypothetical protein